MIEKFGLRRLALFNSSGNILGRVVDIISLLLALRIVGVDAFGVYSLAGIIGMACENIFSLGIDSACIQDRNRPEDYLDTAWWIQFFRSLFIVAVLIIFTPVLGRLFKAQALLICLPILTLSFLFNGLSNIGITVFYRELDIKKKFAYILWTKVIEAIARVLFCLAIGGYLGLLWSLVFAAFVRLVFSYILSSWRPRFKFDFLVARRLAGFGKWVALSGVVCYFLGQIDSFYVSEFLGVMALGLYRLAFKISDLFSEILYYVVYDLFFPLFSAYARFTPKVISAQYSKILKYSVTFSFILSGGLFFAVGPVLSDALGGKWSHVVPLAKIFVFTLPAFMLSNLSFAVLRALGHAHKVVYLQLASFGILALLIYPFSALWGLNGVAVSSLLSVLITMPLIYWVTVAAIHSTEDIQVQLANTLSLVNADRR